MPRGASPKREREFQKLESQFKRERRYPGREEEVAARIVNKQRWMYGETRDERQKDAEGKSSDRDLPIQDFQQLTIRQVEYRMESLSEAELWKIRSYELSHKHRKGLLAKIDRRLSVH